MLKLTVKSLEKKAERLDNKLIRLFNFLYYRQRKLMALNLKWKFKFGTGNWNLGRRNKVLKLKKYGICRIFKRISEEEAIYIRLFY